MSEGNTLEEPECSEPDNILSQATAVERPKKRQKIAVACNACRARKVKCDGVRPGECPRGGLEMAKVDFQQFAVSAFGERPAG